MPMFIDPTERVPVTVGGNTIYIRAKMTASVRARVEDEIAAKGLGDRRDMEMRGLGSYSLALLVHNIVAWEGSDFVDERGKPIPCTRANIERLDLDEPLVVEVREEIGRRNAPKESPDPN